MENMTYKLTDFEGPLDLLLALIEKNKMNILDIQISLICDQYLEFLAQAETNPQAAALWLQFIDQARQEREVAKVPCCGEEWCQCNGPRGRARCGCRQQGLHG